MLGAEARVNMTTKRKSKKAPHVWVVERKTATGWRAEWMYPNHREALSWARFFYGDGYNVRVAKYVRAESEE